MHIKLLKNIIIVFIVLAAVASLHWIMGKSSEKKSLENQKNLSVDLSSFTENSVEKITIKKGEDEKILVHKDNVWQIGESEASPEKVSQLFGSFSKAKVKELVSESENSYIRFDVTRDSGTQLVISQNGKDSLFFIGKAGPVAGQFYIRKDGIKNVYLMDGGSLLDDLKADASKWKKTDEGKSESLKESTI